MQETSIAYIGLDHHHRDPYFQIFDQLPVEIAAVAEPDESFDIGSIGVDEERPDSLESDVDIAAMLSDASVYRDPIECIENEDVDLVWITLSNADTPAVVEAAVDRGFDVFAEKPAARTAADLEPVARKIRDSDVTFGTAYFYRAHPVPKELRSRVLDGFFGDVWSLESRLMATKLEHRRTDHYLYEDKPSRGGILQWIGCHYVDLTTWILDEEVTRVSAQMKSFDEDADIEDGVTIQFETASGTIGTFTTGYFLREGKDSNISIYGSDAWATSPIRARVARDVPIELDIDSESDDWFGAPNRTFTYDMAFNHPPFGDFGFDFFEQFFEAREGSASTPAGIDDALRVLRIMDAAYESADVGEWVDVDPTP